MEKLVLAMGHIKRELLEKIEENKEIINNPEHQDLKDTLESENNGIQIGLSLVERAMDDYARRQLKQTK